MISIVVPAYNEEKIISKTLTAYLKYFSKSSFEFVIVPNGCTDKTVDIVRTFQKDYSNLVIEQIKEPVGKAEAVRRGLVKAKGNVVAYLDADFSTSPEEFQKLLEAMHDADGVIASRLAPGAIVENRTRLRMAAGKTFAAIVKMLFWMPYHDTQCGAKIFTKVLLEKILPLSKVNNIAFDVELLLLAKHAKARIIELPTHWMDRSDSVIIGNPTRLVKTSLKMLFTLINLRFRFLPFFAPKI